jgi:hypothetical protein
LKPAFTVPPLLTRALWALALWAGVVGLDLAQRSSPPPVAQAVWPAGVPSLQGRVLRPVARGHMPMPDGSAAAHASSLVAMPAGHPAALTAFWFAGDRESAPNVQVAASQYLRAEGQWTPARYVVNRKVLSSQLGFGVRRLGNPVGWMDPSGRMHLFVVATGLGGWAAGRIVHLRQTDAANGFEAMEFVPERVLPLSWLWNTSFLVRSAPLPLADGGMVLPVYFELGIKYPVALRFDAKGTLLGMVRISNQPYRLQPTLLMQNSTDWLALTRDYRPHGKIGVARTTDGGQHWSDLPDLALDNPDASIAGMGLAPGQLVLSHNPTAEGRALLDLSGSVDGMHWTQWHAMERGAPDEEYSYPATAWADGALWVSYTDHRRSIAWQSYAAGAP